jgi:hypothetical protein
MPSREALLKMFQAGRLHLTEPEHREFIKAELALLASNPDKGDYEKFSQMYKTEVEVKVTKEPEVKEEKIADKPITKTVVTQVPKKAGRPKKV